MVLCDRCGTRMPAVRSTMEAKIGRAYRGLDISLDCFPEDDVPDDPNAAIRVSGGVTLVVNRCYRSWPHTLLRACLLPR
jgi:hypothetical protein